MLSLPYPLSPWTSSSSSWFKKFGQLCGMDGQLSERVNFSAPPVSLASSAAPSAQAVKLSQDSVKTNLPPSPPPPPLPLREGGRTPNRQDETSLPFLLLLLLV